MNKINRGLIRIIDFLTLILVLPLAFFSVFFSRVVDFDTFREVTVKAARSPFLDIFFTLLFIFIIFCVTWIFRGVSEKNDRIISVVLQLVMIAVTTGVGLWWITISVISAVVFTVIYIRRYKDVTRLNSSGGL